jgi:hypothetical protein
MVILMGIEGKKEKGLVREKNNYRNNINYCDSGQEIKIWLLLIVIG